MNKLLDAYDFIEHYRKRGREVPPDVLQEAEEAEIAYLKKQLASAVKEHIQPILDKIQSRLTLLCDHIPNKPIEIQLSREPGILTLLDDAVMIYKERSEASREKTDRKNSRKNKEKSSQGKSKSIGFTVKFPDGHSISRDTAKATMIETFRYMGFEKVARFKERNFQGYYLVDRRKRVGENGEEHFQEEVEDGWYVYTNISNDTKKIMINRVASMLGVKLSIYDHTTTGNLFDTDYSRSNKNRKARAVYSLNGGRALDKRNSVLNAVKQYAERHPEATFQELLTVFPDRLQGSTLGVIKSLPEIEKIRATGMPVDRYFFFNPQDELTSADGIKYVVCNQWGHNFERLQEHVKSLGWSLEEVP